MKERPILFSGEMVRAILEGRKTQTRMAVKPHLPCEEWNFIRINENGDALFSNGSFCTSAKFPFGVPGDRLWVRETWRMDAYNIAAEYRATTSALMEYIAPWRPSLRMPRWASRITLEIVAVRVERLQDISEEDARKEGVTLRGTTRHETECRDEFRTLWSSIYGHESWDRNDWVWVVEFNREGAR